MNQINKYLMKQLLVSTLLVGFVMTGVIWLFVAVRAVEHIINRGVSIKLFFYLSMLQLPNFIVHIIPFSIFIGILFVYSRLNSDRELVVLRSAGMSPLALAKPALLVAFLAMLIGYSLTLYATPKSYQGFRDLQWNIRYSFAHILLKEGVFNMISADTTVYIRERTGEAELSGILYHDTRNAKKPVTIIAERGLLTKSVAGARVVAYDGNRQVLDEKTNKLSILYFDQYTLDLNGLAPKPENRFREARERMVGELLALKIADVGNPKDFGKFKVEGHKNLTLPINTIVFSLVALACLLLGDFSRHGQAKRIMLASIIFVGLWVGNIGIISMCAKNLQMIPFLYGSVIAPTLIILLLLIFHPRFKRRVKEFTPTKFSQADY